MLDGGSFMKSGWVHELKLHTFFSEGTRFVVMAKIILMIITKMIKNVTKMICRKQMSLDSV